MAEQLTDGTSAVTLAIPCRPEYVALCRLVAGAIGTRDGLDEELMSDIKVLVTEACNCFLAMANGDSPDEASGECVLRMDFDSRPDAFEITVLYPRRHELVAWLEGCDSMSEAGLGLTILKALADRMTEVETDDGTALRLTKLLAE
jgi:anti-sigma regulatory factor (Ser/Thr protein kinase)